MRDFWYGFGGFISLLGVAGVAEAITGRGMIVSGLFMILIGVGFMGLGWTYDHFRNY